MVSYAKINWEKMEENGENINIRLDSFEHARQNVKPIRPYYSNERGAR